MKEYFDKRKVELEREVTIQAIRFGVIKSTERVRVVLSTIKESPDVCKLEETIPFHEFDQFGYHGKWAYNRLQENGVCTWRDLFAKTDRDLLKLRNFGKHSLTLVEQVLWGHGWVLVYERIYI
ncbi:MAG: DNA-directed RNA polymerase subunit alpha C-terminal domain-containing protein [bacterium]|nr:DNA-directed RNA polymerase subunit alpha C-terminal domain-containing protein [bacterium]